MEIFIPLNQMIFFVALISFSFLFSRYRLGLSIVFSFSFYWAFVYNRDRLLTGPDGWGALPLICGSALILFALFSLLAETGLIRKKARVMWDGR